jgi:hypothetical protein
LPSADPDQPVAINVEERLGLSALEHHARAAHQVVVDLCQRRLRTQPLCAGCAGCSRQGYLRRLHPRHTPRAHHRRPRVLPDPACTRASALTVEGDRTRRLRNDFAAALRQCRSSAADMSCSSRHGAGGHLSVAVAHSPSWQRRTEGAFPAPEIQDAPRPALGSGRGRTASAPAQSAPAGWRARRAGSLRCGRTGRGGALDPAPLVAGSISDPGWLGGCSG